MAFYCPLMLPKDLPIPPCQIYEKRMFWSSGTIHPWGPIEAKNTFAEQTPNFNGTGCPCLEPSDQMSECSAEFFQYLSQHFPNICRSNICERNRGQKCCKPAGWLWEFARSGRATLKITPAVRLCVNHCSYSYDILGYLGIAKLWGYIDLRYLF